MRRALTWLPGTLLLVLGGTALVAALVDAVRGRRESDRTGLRVAPRLVWASNEEYARLLGLRRRRRVDAVVAQAGAVVAGAGLGWLAGRPG